MKDSLHDLIARAALTIALALSVPAEPLPVAMADDPAGHNLIQRTNSEPEEFGGLDIEQLSRVRIVSATLTPTQVRLVPAKTTVLDEATIAQSGARNLNESLEIYAPNTQLILHNTHLDHFGIRGIISDRDDKYLLRVNGKVMNNRFFVGAESERDLPLLGDFRSVTLVHGPASATYGAGALAGVMNLETYNGLTFEGTDAQVRQGFRDQFTAGEFRFGQKFNEESGLFLYVGVADQSGSNQHDSPYVFGKSFATPGSGPAVVSGQPVTFPEPNLHDAGDILKMKYHASYVNGPVEIWARFTQGGGVVRPMRTSLQTVDISIAQKGRANLDRQFTAATKYKQDLSKVFNLETFVSYDWYQYRLWVYDQFADPQNRQEHEAYGRMLGTWTPNEKQSLAFGLEYSHMWFDGPRLGFGPGPGIPPVEDAWETDTISFLVEHQWHLGEKWTTFASARVDKHTYTDWLFSPRLALVFTPGSKDTLKLIGARAMRRSGEGELREEHVRSGTQGDTETLDSLEFRYERQHDAHWNFGCSVFIEQNDAIGFDAAANRSVAVGTFRIWGVEPEITFRSEKTRLTFSHGYTKLFDSSLASAATIQGITAEPYGFGHDLANWANNITKLALIQELNGKWAASTSLRAYWGFPGAKALADWNGAQSQPRSFALADPGYDAAYGPSVFWNAGLEYRPTKHLTVRADAFNILGWADQTLNKRIYFFRGSDYSSEAASVALSAKLTF
ncbi:TonB-dependent receptor plug domain-containing protein [Geotalea uraniireducens]|uniref:TonB-dependent receptor, plug n=1 Tax=Geotalea uraniireducens (strain Rf4) TaxID=351605 RepID=A5GE95_GEOUR|nr:TonB-dependent receptor [Geotalea uraniireducens]ABQ25750.1 TonB-dependent receptor, plug [Geotalea uraniireducens Rf4]